MRLTLLALLFPLQIAAAEKPFDLTVSAGKYDRHYSPVCVTLLLSADQAKSVTLKDAAGEILPAQITAPGIANPDQHDPAKACELHFILPRLKAGAELKLTAVVSDAKPDKTTGFYWKDTPGHHLDLLFKDQPHDRPVLRYQYKALDESTKESREQTFKVFHHLYDPTGELLLTNGPNGLYPHHRGIFFGFNKITYGEGKKADTWHCTDGAYQGHEKMLVQEAGPVLGRHRVRIGWHGEKGEKFAEEDRELTVYNVPNGELVEFASLLKTTNGPVKLDGDPQHAGFHFRADKEVAERDAEAKKNKTEPETFFIRPDGVGKPGETRNWDPKTRQGPVNLPWNAMSFVLDYRRWTVAYLDKPTNPKEARGSEREYGRIGSYFEYELTEKRPLRVNYRLWLQDRTMRVEEVAALDNDFVNPVTVQVK